MLRSSISVVQRSRERIGRTCPLAAPFLAGLRETLRAFLRASVRDGRRVERDDGRLARPTRKSARTSSGLVIECQRLMPLRLAMLARFFRERDLRVSEVMRANSD